ncbi:MAG: hypothetical protein KDD70_12770, partial [Bdellovibrionales bacterium]|nr:hypothetical protein [Bdellovibrionales bacterium]
MTGDPTPQKEEQPRDFKLDSETAKLVSELLAGPSISNIDLSKPRARHSAFEFQDFSDEPSFKKHVDFQPHRNPREERRYKEGMRFDQRLPDKNLFKRDGQDLNLFVARKIIEKLENGHVDSALLEIQIDGGVNALRSTFCTRHAALKTQRLLKEGDTRDAERIADAFSFSPEERKAIVVMALAEEISSPLFVSRIFEGKVFEERKGSLLQALLNLGTGSMLGLSGEVLKEIALPTYRLVLQDALRTFDSRDIAWHEDFGMRTSSFKDRHEELSPLAQIPFFLLKSQVPTEEADSIDREACEQILRGGYRTTKQVRSLMDLINPKSELLAEPEMVELRTARLVRHIKGCSGSYGAVLIDEALTGLRLGEEALTHPEVEGAVRDSYLQALQNGNLNLAGEYEAALPQVADQIDVEVRREAAEAGARSLAERGEFARFDAFIAAKEIDAKTILPDELLCEKVVQVALRTIDRVSMTHEHLIREAAETGLMKRIIADGWLDVDKVLEGIDRAIRNIDNGASQTSSRADYGSVIALCECFLPPEAAEEKLCGLLIERAAQGDRKFVEKLLARISPEWEAFDREQFREASIRGFLAQVVGYKGEDPNKMPRPGQFGLRREDLRSSKGVLESLAGVAKEMALLGRGRCANRLINDFLPEEQREGVSLEILRGVAEAGYPKEVDSLILRNLISPAYIESEEYQASARKGLLNFLHRDAHQRGSLSECIRQLRISEEGLSAFEIQRAISEEAAKQAATRRDNSTIEYIEHLRIPELRNWTIGVACCAAASAGNSFEVESLLKLSEEQESIVSSKEFQLAAVDGMFGDGVQKKALEQQKVKFHIREEALSLPEVQQKLLGLGIRADGWREEEIQLAALQLLGPTETGYRLHNEVKRGAIRGGKIGLLKELRALRSGWDSADPDGIEGAQKAEAETGEVGSLNAEVEPSARLEANVYAAKEGLLHFLRDSHKVTQSAIHEALELLELNRADFVDDHSQARLRAIFDSCFDTRNDGPGDITKALSVALELLDPEHATSVLESLVIRAVAAGDSASFSRLTVPEHLSEEFLLGEGYQTAALKGLKRTLAYGGATVEGVLPKIVEEFRLTEETLESVQFVETISEALTTLSGAKDSDNAESCIAILKDLPEGEKRLAVLTTFLPTVVRVGELQSLPLYREEVGEVAQILEGTDCQEAAKLRLLGKIDDLNGIEVSILEANFKLVPLSEDTAREPGFLHQVERHLVKQGRLCSSGEKVVSAINLLLPEKRRRSCLEKAYIECVRTGKPERIAILAKAVGINGDSSFVASEEFQAAALTGFEEFLEFRTTTAPSKGALTRIISGFHLGDEARDQEEYKRAVFTGVAKAASNGWDKVVTTLIDEASKPEWRTELTLTALEGAAKKGELRILSALERAYPLEAKLCFAGERYQSAAREGAIRWINRVESETKLKIRKVQEIFHLSDDSVQSDDVQEITRAKIVHSANISNGAAAQALLEHLVPEEERGTVAKKALSNIFLGQGISREQRELISKYGEKLNPQDSENGLPEPFQILSRNLRIH